VCCGQLWWNIVLSFHWFEKYEITAFRVISHLYTDIQDLMWFVCARRKEMWILYFEEIYHCEKSTLRKFTTVKNPLWGNLPLWKIHFEEIYRCEKSTLRNHCEKQPFWLVDQPEQWFLTTIPRIELFMIFHDNLEVSQVSN